VNTIVVVVLAVAVLALIALAFGLHRARRRDADRLQERFGSEWDRTVGRADGRKERRNAQQELAERAETRDELDIRPLGAASRQQYTEQWHDTQAHFVDAPQDALHEAETLLDQVMRERGYPVDGFDEQASLISVDHPDLVENYRAAHALRERSRNGATSTEDMRDAMLRYRSLFDELLAPV
jgi:hypothetical protein